MNGNIWRVSSELWTVNRRLAICLSYSQHIYLTLVHLIAVNLTLFHSLLSLHFPVSSVWVMGPLIVFILNECLMTQLTVMNNTIVLCYYSTSYMISTIYHIIIIIKYSVLVVQLKAKKKKGRKKNQPTTASPIKLQCGLCHVWIFKAIQHSDTDSSYYLDDNQQKVV